MTDSSERGDTDGSTAGPAPQAAGPDESNRDDAGGVRGGTRRHFLAAVSAASAALAGCPGGSDAGETNTPMPEPSETPTATASETPTPEPAPTPTATATPQPVNGVRIPGTAQTELGLGAVAFEEVTIDEGGE